MQKASDQRKKNKAIKIQEGQSRRVINKKEMADFELPTNKLRPYNSQKKILKSRASVECWTIQEVQKLFNVYDQFGSQWTLISAQFPKKTPNAIKNRFYTTIRLCLKALHRELSSHQKKPSNQIPSKTLLRLYESQQKFSKIKGLCRVILKQMNYQCNSENVPQIVDQHKEQLIEMFRIIYQNEGLEDNSPSSQNALNLRRARSAEQVVDENSQQREGQVKVENICKIQQKEGINIMTNPFGGQFNIHPAHYTVAPFFFNSSFYSPQNYHNNK